MVYFGLVYQMGVISNHPFYQRPSVAFKYAFFKYILDTISTTSIVEAFLCHPFLHPNLVILGGHFEQGVLFLKVCKVRMLCIKLLDERPVNAQ